MPMTGRRHRAAVALVVVAVVAVGTGPVTAAPVIGLPATHVVLNAGVSEAVYGGVDYGNPVTSHDDRSIRTTWRVVQGTGNASENYLTTTPDGMLLDFGNHFLAYSRDRGLTWRQLQPLAPMAGEGAVVAAPGGDILGVTWSPYVAEQMHAFKYEADTEQWLYMPVPHAPWYDREWIGVVPGPVTILGQTYPYVSFIKERLDRHWLYSTDGLNYLPLPTPELITMAAGTAVEVGPLPITPDPSLDWAQGNSNTGIIPLGGGKMLAAPGLPDGLADGESFAYSLLDGEAFSWTPYAFPGDEAPAWIAGSSSRHQVDSAGRVHNVLPRPDGTGFTYRISHDAGVTWQSLDVSLPPDTTFDAKGCCALGGPGAHRWDFRANLAAGVAAVAIRGYDASTGYEQDLVYKFDITGDVPVLSRLLKVGLGDMLTGQGFSGDPNAGAFDFGTLAIFPDGRVAVSFKDSTTQFVPPGSGRGNDPYEVHAVAARGAPTSAPAIAIEGDTEFGGPLSFVPETEWPLRFGAESGTVALPDSPEGCRTEAQTAGGVLAAPTETSGQCTSAFFGYATTYNDVPGVSRPARFLTEPLSQDTVIGGTAELVLHLADPLRPTASGAGVGGTCPWALLAVAPNGTMTQLASGTSAFPDGVNAGRNEATLGIPAGLIPAGHRLQFEISHAGATGSAARMLYGGGDYADAGLVLTTGALT